MCINDYYCNNRTFDYLCQYKRRIADSLEALEAQTSLCLNQALCVLAGGEGRVWYTQPVGSMPQTQYPLYHVILHTLITMETHKSGRAN